MRRRRRPELLSALAPLAVTQISNDRPDVAVEVLLRGAAFSYNPKRIRVFMDDSFIVVKVDPVMG
uniref:Uncharacterized protein n=1 Tax=Oryza brachyantha TaxID=4533 RepID=J3L963_ORYBR